MSLMYWMQAPMALVLALSSPILSMHPRQHPCRLPEATMIDRAPPSPECLR